MPLRLVRRDVLRLVVVTLYFLALNQLLAFLFDDHFCFQTGAVSSQLRAKAVTKGGVASNFQFRVLPLHIRWRGPKIKRDLLAAPFQYLFLVIVRSRNSCINDPIRSTSSSNAKWPVSRRWSSALGISLLKSSAPSTVKIPSFSPQAISMGGCCLRKYSCQSA